MLDKAMLLRKMLSRSTYNANGCLVWQGARNPDGYGNIRVITHPTIRWWKVHRLSWYLAYGTLPDSVLHVCDNPPCWRIDHLFAGNQDLNMKDAASKGRLRKGHEHPKSLLTEEQVREIKEYFATVPRSDKGWIPHGGLKALAAKYRVSVETIQQIRYGRAWQHVELYSMDADHQLNLFREAEL